MSINQDLSRWFEIKNYKCRIATRVLHSLAHIDAFKRFMDPIAHCGRIIRRRSEGSRVSCFCGKSKGGI